MLDRDTRSRSVFQKLFSASVGAYILPLRTS